MSYLYAFKNHDIMSKHNKNKREDENARTEAQEKQQEEISGNQQAEAAQDGSKESKEEASAKEDNGKNLLEEAQKQVQEEKNRYVYLMAEFDNYRRRVSQEKIDLIDTAAKGVINDLLPVVDNFERALKSMEESEASDSAKMGTELIYKQLIDVLKKKGVRVCTGALVERAEQTDNGIRVHFTAKGKPDFAEGEAVLCAVGRRAAWEGIFAPGLQPELDGRILKVNERYETSISGVYAIGDVASQTQLAHVASAQGQAFAELLCGKETHVDMRIVPSCVYCRPEIAVVGLTDAEAKAAGIPVKTGKCVLGGNARTLIEDPGRSFMKVLAHAETGEILGAQLMCLGAPDMISQISEAIANHMTPRQLLLAMRPHPTFEEALSEALEDLASKLER